MKTILFLAHDDHGQEARFQVALDVTRAVDGHLCCVDVSPPHVPINDAFSRAALLLADEYVATEADNRGRLIERLKREDVRWDWSDVVGEIASALTAKARLADLIVLNGHLDDNQPHMPRIAADVLVNARRPVLVVPEGVLRITLAGARVMIAWDGSDQAAHSLSMAVPLMRFAGDVTIVEIGDETSAIAGEEAATYLARHGIHPAILRVPQDDDFLPIALLDRARALRADYLVMGGFGHWRLTERLLRCNSHWMLTSAHIPLLMAH